MWFWNFFLEENFPSRIQHINNNIQSTRRNHSGKITDSGLHSAGEDLAVLRELESLKLNINERASLEDELMKIELKKNSSITQNTT